MDNKQIEEIKTICDTFFALEKVKSSSDSVNEFEKRQEFKRKIHNLQKKILDELMKYE